jgi:hypothetical protein
MAMFALVITVFIAHQGKESGGPHIMVAGLTDFFWVASSTYSLRVTLKCAIRQGYVWPLFFQSEDG